MRASNLGPGTRSVDDHGPGGFGKVKVARHKIGVKVGLKDVSDPDTVPFGPLEVRL